MNQSSVNVYIGYDSVPSQSSFQELGTYSSTYWQDWLLITHGTAFRQEECPAQGYSLSGFSPHPMTCQPLAPSSQVDVAISSPELPYGIGWGLCCRWTPTPSLSCFSHTPMDAVSKNTSQYIPYTLNFILESVSRESNLR